jgi:hypothetical protein
MEIVVFAVIRFGIPGLTAIFGKFLWQSRRRVLLSEVPGARYTLVHMMRFLKLVFL